MDFDGDLNFNFGKKLTARKGRRAGNASSPKEDAAADGTIDSPGSAPGSGLSRGSLQELEDALPAAPPRSRRSGGWADEGVKSGKKRSASNIIEQERFRRTDDVKDDSDDDIPVIPDLDDIQDEDLTTQIASTPSVNLNKVAAYKELDSDLFKHSAFGTLDNINLQLLTKSLRPENDVKEIDEPWNWDLLFTDIASELHSEWESTENKAKEVT
ncbi:intraflagellar transport protein 43 homolog isoform X1 [Schistocerca nitens]|uniref:intraflagellar transport protein 43 homolog isoform X1 n=1 Tax=Schistocerca nitens TaxID=7011 RepID=UPI00211949CA|nr:intraflagellar transport protein 43 homolog isoform X1 [Schistocerca nitens]